MSCTNQTDNTPQERPSWVKICLTAARPHTLTASLSPCLVSYACTHPPLFLILLWFFFCLCIQLGTNLHNDYADFVQGADDKDKRVGQPRATAQGWLTPLQTCVAATSMVALALAIGIYVAVLTEQTHSGVYWMLIGTSALNAFAYTGGPYPLGYLGFGTWSIGYAGLGDVFVFLYFGLGATCTLPLVLHWQGHRVVGFEVVAAGAQVGLLAINIIVVNNLRDRLTDVLVGKRTLAVRFGRKFCLVEYIACNVGAFVLVLVDFALSKGDFWRLLPLLAIPLAMKETKAVLNKEGAELNKHVGGAAKVQLLFCVLFLAGRV